MAYLQYTITESMDSGKGKNADNQPGDSYSDEMKDLGFPSASLDMLIEYGRKMKSCTGYLPCHASSSQEFSTEEIMQIARAKLLQYTSKGESVFCVMFDPFRLVPGLSPETCKDVELALLLQASAQAFSLKEYYHARQLLSLCAQSASSTGNPVQRVVHYFAEAIGERMDKETGALSPLASKRKPVNMVEAFISLLPAISACQQELPFAQVSQFTGMQAILDSIKSARRVHLIDFGIQIGSHSTIIMHALANRDECPLQLLKITAVTTYQEKIKEIGKWLSSFAETINLPFSFKVVASDLKDLKKDLFELEAGEVVAIYSDYCLWTMLPMPSHLEALIGVVKSLDPSVMVVCEIEADTNSSTFMGRFNPLLSYFSAIFDCYETCLDQNSPYRTIAEGVYHREMIRNVITSEGEERVHRCAKIDFWRDFFARFGFIEAELSQFSLSQASLLTQRRACWKYCSLGMDGKSLIINWKGTPVKSVSAWKFQHHG